MLVLLAVAAMAAVAGANTEVAVFELAARAGDGVLAPLVPLSAQFEFADASVETLALPLANASAGKYLARVCWPASHPADVSIAFDEDARAVVVVASKEDVVSLRGTAHSVPFDIHLSPMRLGLIPADVIPAILSTSAVALLSAGMAYILLKRM